MCVAQRCAEHLDSGRTDRDEFSESSFLKEKRKQTFTFLGTILEGQIETNLVNRASLKEKGSGCEADIYNNFEYIKQEENYHGKNHWY